MVRGPGRTLKGRSRTASVEIQPNASTIRLVARMQTSRRALDRLLDPQEYQRDAAHPATCRRCRRSTTPSGTGIKPILDAALFLWKPTIRQRGRCWRSCVKAWGWLLGSAPNDLFSSFALGPQQPLDSRQGNPGFLRVEPALLGVRRFPRGGVWSPMSRA